MPDYDLGTAHGRIKIDYDDTGAKKAKASTSDIERNMEKLDRRMAQIQRTMTGLERELKNLANVMQQAAEETGDFEEEIDDLHHGFDRLHGSSGTAAQDMLRLAKNMEKAARAARTIIPPMTTLYQVVTKFQAGKGGFVGFLRALGGTGVASLGIGGLTNRLLGLNKAMKDVPRWQQQILKLGGALSSLAAVGAFASFLQRHTTGSNLFSKSLQSVSRHSRIATNTMKALAQANDKVLFSLRNAGGAMNNMAKGIYQSVSGLAVMKLGLNSLTSRFGKLGRITKLVLLSLGALGALGPAALEALNKALTVTSNLVAGLWNGIKQLSGGFLALPAAISMVIASFSTLGVVFKGIGEKFGDITQGGEEALAALFALPPHLQKMGRAIYMLMPKLREFQTQIQKAFDFDRAADELNRLATAYLPKLQSGMIGVASAFKSGRARLVEFLEEAQTLQDTERMFSLTSRTLQNFNYTIKPLARGLKDISLAGAEFINVLSAGLPGLSQKFSEWARVNRENGNLTRWMKESWIGVKDLTKGMRDLIKATYTLLTLFATNDGSNFLERFANAMARFNKTVTDSAASGTLKKIGDAVRNMGTEHIETFKDVMRSVIDAFEEAWPVIKQFSSAVSDVMVPAIKLALQILELIFAGLENSPIAKVIGWVGGLAAAFVALKYILGPLRNIIQISAGAFTLYKGAQNIILSLVGSLETMGDAGKKAANKLSSVGDSIAKFASRAGIVALVIAGIYSGIDGAKAKIKSFDDVLKNSEKGLKDWGEGFRKAFIADRGVGSNVLSHVTEGVGMMQANLEAKARELPNLWDHITSIFDEGAIQGSAVGGGFKFGQSEAFNQGQKMAQDAEQAIKAFERLGYSTEDLTRIVSGTPEYFKAMTNHIRKSGDGGNEAANELQRLRNEFLAIQEASEKLGPGKLQVVEGLKQIAEAAGDSDKKLNGLKNVLEGLGLIQTSALQASAEYAESIRDLSQNLQEAISSGGGLTNIIDAQTGAIDVTTQAGKNLLDVLAPVGEQYLNLVSKGENAEEAFQKFQTALVNGAKAAGANVEAVQRLAEQLGLVDPEKLGTKLQELLNGGDKELLIRLGIDEETIKKIQEQLQSSGITITPEVNLDGNKGNKDGSKDNKLKSEVEQNISEAEKSLREFTDHAQDEIDKTAADAYVSGSKFAAELARGMRENKSQIDSAAGLLAGTALGYFHQSPPKEGPLAKHGDAVLYAGKQFSGQYAEGITEKTGDVRGAASYMAGQAIGGTSTGNSGISQVGRYLGQLFDIAEIAQRVNDIFSKVSSTVFEAFRFISDPLGKGTFFGKNTYSKTVSDEQLAAQRNLQAQQDLFGIAGGAQRNITNWEKRGQLLQGAPKNDVVSAIVAEGQRRGLNQEQIVAAIATAGHESSYGQNTVGKGHGAFLPGGGKGTAYGVFQQTPEGGWGTPEQLLDPNFAINAFYDKYQQNLAKGLSPLNAAVYTQNPQLGTNAAGTEYGSITGNFINEARGLYGQAIAGQPGILGAMNGFTPSGGLPPIGTASGPIELFGAHDQFSVAAQIASGFGVRFGTGATNHSIDNGFHPSGQAGDFNGTPEQLASFAQAMMSNFAPYIRELIFEGPGISSNVYNGQLVPAIDMAGSPYNTGQAGYHGDHVHIAILDEMAQAFANAAVHGGVQIPTQQQRRLPTFLDPYSGGDTNQIIIQRNPDGTYSQTAPHGEKQGAAPGPNDINELTGKPYTEEEKAKILAENPLEFTLPEGMTFERFQQLQQDKNNFFFGTEKEFQDQLSKNPAVAAAYGAQAGGYSTLSDPASTLESLDLEINRLRGQNTPQSLAGASQLESLKSDIMAQTGYTQDANPIDAVSGLVAGASGVASSIIASVTSGLESVAATKNITGILTRNVANTEDVYNMVDNIQKYLEFAANIAGSVANVSGVVASVIAAAGGADPSGGASGAATAVAAVSAIASGVQAGIETTNAIIDLGQLVYRIAGTYVGDFLGYLTGGAGGQLAGNVKFLLDQETNQLLAYSAENPLDKRAHTVPFSGGANPDARSQLIGNINVYGGPGSDPRDLTRNMMFQVNSAQYAGALAS